MFWHLRAAVFHGYLEVSNPSSLDKIFYFTTGLGHQAVMIFFVLSGFLIGGSIINSKDGFSLKIYFINRIARLWTVLLPALIFTAIMDYWFYDELIALSPFGNQSLSTADRYSASLYSFFGNLLFLQNILVPVFGTNGPLWSLSNELWYYVMFPLLFLGWFKLSRGGVYYLLVGLIILCWLPFELTKLFPVWLIGVFVYCNYGKYRITFPGFLCSVILFLAVLTLSRFKLVGGVFSDYMVGVATGALILSSSVVEQYLLRGGLFRHFIVWLSSISYTLYLFHFPVIVAFVSIMDGKTFPPGQMGYAVYAGISFFVIIFSWVVWLMFERNTNAVKSLLLTLVNNKKAI